MKTLKDVPVGGHFTLANAPWTKGCVFRRDGAAANFRVLCSYVVVDPITGPAWAQVGRTCTIPLYSEIEEVPQ